MFSRGVRVVYSNLLRLKADLQAHQPDAFISVPLLLDTLHAKVWVCACAYACVVMCFFFGGGGTPPATDWGLLSTSQSKRQEE